MKERKFEAGVLVFELKEEKPRVLKVLELRNNVVTAETENGVCMAHVSNFRLASREEINERRQSV